MKSFEEIFADYDFINMVRVADERNATPEMQKRNPDWNKLRVGLEHAHRIHAYCVGESDEKSWAVVVGLCHPQEYNFPEFALIESSCDYTGWDCRSGGSWTYASNYEDLKKHALTDELRERLIWIDTGSPYGGFDRKESI